MPNPLIVNGLNPYMHTFGKVLPKSFLYVTYGTQKLRFEMLAFRDCQVMHITFTASSIDETVG